MGTNLIRRFLPVRQTGTTGTAHSLPPIPWPNPPLTSQLALLLPSSLVHSLGVRVSDEWEVLSLTKPPTSHFTGYIPQSSSNESFTYWAISVGKQQQHSLRYFFPPGPWSGGQQASMKPNTKTQMEERMCVREFRPKEPSFKSIIDMYCADVHWTPMQETVQENKRKTDSPPSYRLPSCGLESCFLKWEGKNVEAWVSDFALLC